MNKILILANNSSGLYDFRNELIRELVERGNQVTVYTPFDLKVVELKRLGISVKEIAIDRRGMNPIRDLKLCMSYLQILIHEKPQLVITYTIKPNVYGGIACRLVKIPYAINITGLGTAFENNGILKKLVIIMNKMACKNAKVVFFENEQNRQIFIREKIVKESQTVRLNGAGVNLDKFQMAEYPKEAKVKFLFMGRVMAEKGVNELLTAMKMLISEGSNCELYVLGRYEESYKEIIEKYEGEGWLHYCGYQEDVRPFIHMSHCFVLPSWHEGMANTNLECAASGRPVITSNIFGCKESVIDGVSGFLVEKKNSEKLYSAMKRFLELSYEERMLMGVAGRRHMEQMFDKKSVVKDTLRCLF